MIEVAGDTLRVSGPMVITTVASLRDPGAAAIASGATVVDLAAVSEADS
jgi:ABC-type transporter Mla MlaB component